MAEEKEVGSIGYKFRGYLLMKKPLKWLNVVYPRCCQHLAESGYPSTNISGLTPGNWECHANFGGPYFEGELAKVSAGPPNLTKCLAVKGIST